MFAALFPACVALMAQSTYNPTAATPAWVDACLLRIENEGLAPSYHFLGGPQTSNRADVATALRGATEHIDHLLAGLENQLRSTPLRNLKMVDQGCVIDEIDALTSATDIRLLPDVAMELKRDLAFQGVEEPDFDKLIASEKRFPIRIQSLANQIPQFEDVPTDHWAAKAVLELRRLGILMGYPDGKFKG